MLIGGVDRDANCVAEHIASRAARTTVSTREAEVVGADQG